jgi:hypothetical protein
MRLSLGACPREPCGGISVIQPPAPITQRRRGRRSFRRGLPSCLVRAAALGQPRPRCEVVACEDRRVDAGERIFGGSAIVSGGWLWPGRRELSCYFKYMARGGIPEFESHDPSHAVVSSAVMTGVFWSRTTVAQKPEVQRIFRARNLRAGFPQGCTVPRVVGWRVLRYTLGHV